jgi:Flp pilus assembly protein TadD
MAQDQSNTQTEDTFENRVNCASGQLLPQAQAASAKGDTAKALELAQQYQHAYPQDPTGMLALGWYQYLHGDLAAALATTQQFEQAAPDQPFGPSNRAVILLAQGKSSKAQDAVKTTLQKLDAEPLSLRLRHLADIGSDLLLLGRDNRGARAGLRTVIPQFEHYLAALPPEARDDQGARLIEVFNNLGGAALWAGDDATAQRLYQAGLAINGDWAMLRSNLGLARLVAHDIAGAQQAYDQAIAAAAGYLAGPDGKPLAGAAATEAKARAKSEIEVAAGALDLLLKQQPALAAQGTPLLQRLRTAAANYQ